MRVGVVTGEVAVTVGAEQQGMVAGDPVNTASRVQGVATSGSGVGRRLRGASHLKGELDVATAAMAKYYTTDLQCALIDECLQFFGGYGYMWEYPIARLYADARVQKIYGGTNEIMKELIGRTL